MVVNLRSLPIFAADMYRLSCLPNGGVMKDRKLTDIVKDQTPLVLAELATVQQACRSMWEHVGALQRCSAGHRQ